MTGNIFCTIKWFKIIDFCSIDTIKILGKWRRDQKFSLKKSDFLGFQTEWTINKWHFLPEFKSFWKKLTIVVCEQFGLLFTHLISLISNIDHAIIFAKTLYVKKFSFVLSFSSANYSIIQWSILFLDEKVCASCCPKLKDGHNFPVDKKAWPHFSKLKCLLTFT